MEDFLDMSFTKTRNAIEHIFNGDNEASVRKLLNQQITEFENKQNVLPPDQLFGPAIGPTLAVGRKEGTIEALQALFLQECGLLVRKPQP